MWLLGFFTCWISSALQLFSLEASGLGPELLKPPQGPPEAAQACDQGTNHAGHYIEVMA